MLLVMLAALLLTFSRGAWGQFAFAALLMMVLTFVTTRSTNERIRIVLVAVAGVMVIAGFRRGAALDRPGRRPVQGARHRSNRATTPVTIGRFGRYLLGVDLALQHPFGVGPLQFARYFPEDPHNSYLNAFMSGGWLAGVAYPTLILISAVMGLRFVFVPTPWQATYHAVYVDVSRHGARERHHRQRPLAPLLPAHRRPVGLDGGVAVVCPADTAGRGLGALTHTGTAAGQPPGNAHSFVNACGPLGRLLAPATEAA